MTVQNFVKIVWTVFEKFEIFMKRSGEKKQHDCISSRKFFPTPKKVRCYEATLGQLGLTKFLLIFIEQKKSTKDSSLTMNKAL